jgi:hypothetical protein
MIIPAGKPLVSIPAFIVITFESSVLWACLFTLIGMVILTRLHSAQKLQIEVCDPRFLDDKFGIIINGLKRGKAEKVTSLLEEQGALEVFNGYVLNDKKEKPVEIPLEQRGIEPDEPSVGIVTKLAVALTLFLVATFFGVRMLFDYSLATELGENGYNYKNKAVAPSYRTIDQEK